MVINPEYYTKLYTRVAVAACLLLTLAACSLAQENILIEADTFTINGKDKRVLAEGNVEIAQKDIKARGKRALYTQDKREISLDGDVVLTYKGVTMNAAHMLIDSVREIAYADNGVKYYYQDIAGQSRKATFYSAEGRVVLQGNTEVRQGEDYIRGEQIEIYLKDKQIKTFGRTKVKLSPDKIRR